MTTGEVSPEPVRPGPEDVILGVVGDGLGALLVYTTAIYLGLRPEQVGIFGETLNPISTYYGFASNLRQTVLRSESESHFLPADWPTFAQLEAAARLNPTPLLRSIRRKFNPGVSEILTEATVVCSALGYPSRVIGGRKVDWVVREADAAPYFSLYDAEARLMGRAKHAVLAPGHGPLAFPGAFGKAREDPHIRDRVVQAYEPKTYVPGGRYLVVGSGIAAVNEWANIIEANAEVIALRRNPTPTEQDLNVPRCLFDGSGIDAFQGHSFEERVAFLGRALSGTSPARRGWAQTVLRARSEGRFEEFIGNVTAIRPGHYGLKVALRSLDGTDVGEVDVTGIICGTGFVKSALSIPVLRRLVQTYGVPVERERIQLKTNCGVPPLDRDDSRLALMGITANTVVPNGDTLAGLKYIARRFVGDVVRQEKVPQRSFAGRLGLQLSLSGSTIAALRALPDTPQIA